MIKPPHLFQSLSRIRLLPVLAACAVLLGATSESCKLAREIDNRSDFDFTTELELKNAAGDNVDTFDQEDRVYFVLTVHNGEDHEVELEFDSTLVADFVVLEAGSDEIVWRASDESNPQSVTTTETWEANETRTFTYDAVLVSGDAYLSRGDYEARGAIVYDFDFDEDPRAEDELASNEIEFSID